MKKSTLFFLLVTGLYTANSFAQEKKKAAPASTKKEKPVYDAELAAKLGADQYGMKQYVMAFIKAGPNRSSDSTERARLQMAHLKNIMKMADEGKLVVAGPFMDDQPIRGIYIFNVKTIEEA